MIIKIIECFYLEFQYQVIIYDLNLIFWQF